MEARVIGHVHHAGAAEDGAIGVDDRRAVEGLAAIHFEKIEHDDHFQFAGQRRENIRGRTRDGFSQGVPIRTCRLRREKPVERKLGKTKQIRAIARRFANRGNAFIDVFSPATRCGLLDQGDFRHDRIPGSPPLSVKQRGLWTPGYQFTLESLNFDPAVGPPITEALAAGPTRNGLTGTVKVQTDGDFV
ncbi:hypothetical protein MnTg04_00384 [bacterium MnTg04]|nr:hypothetical protein MnTg04_00384 [bacterium MnTg04]